MVLATGVVGMRNVPCKAWVSENCLVGYCLRDLLEEVCHSGQAPRDHSLVLKRS